MKKFPAHTPLRVESRMKHLRRSLGIFCRGRSPSRKAPRFASLLSGRSRSTKATAAPRPARSAMRMSATALVSAFLGCSLATLLLLKWRRKRQVQDKITKARSRREGAFEQMGRAAQRFQEQVRGEAVVFFFPSPPPHSSATPRSVQ